MLGVREKIILTAIESSTGVSACTNLYCVIVSRFECVIQSVPSPSLVQCGVGIWRGGDRHGIRGVCAGLCLCVHVCQCHTYLVPCHSLESFPGPLCPLWRIRTNRMSEDIVCSGWLRYISDSVDSFHITTEKQTLRGREYVYVRHEPTSICNHIFTWRASFAKFCKRRQRDYTILLNVLKCKFEQTSVWLIFCPRPQPIPALPQHCHSTAENVNIHEIIHSY